MAGKYISSTEITCNTPSFEKFGPMDVVVRVAIKGDPFTVNKAMFRFYVNTKVHLLRLLHSLHSLHLLHVLHVLHSLCLLHLLRLYVPH